MSELEQVGLPQFELKTNKMFQLGVVVAGHMTVTTSHS